MPRGNGWRYAGIDEANHGRSPEIFVAVYSDLLEDVYCHTTKQFPKRRNNHKSLAGRLAHRDYAFVIVSKDTLQTYREEQVFGSVVVSLIEPIIRLGRLEQIWIDGQPCHQQEEEMWRRLRREFGITEKDISIQFGPKYDTKVQIVNIADELAHHLFHRPLEKIAKNHHKVDLLLQ